MTHTFPTRRASDLPFDAATAKGIAATVEVELGTATIKSITAYRKSRVGTTLDLDGLPINMVSFKSDYAQHQFSEELQVYGSAGDLDWIAGAYYFIEKGTERSEIGREYVCTPVTNAQIVCRLLLVENK